MIGPHDTADMFAVLDELDEQMQRDADELDLLERREAELDAECQYDPRGAFLP